MKRSQKNIQQFFQRKKVRVAVAQQEQGQSSNSEDEGQLVNAVQLEPSASVCLVFGLVVWPACKLPNKVHIMTKVT